MSDPRPFPHLLRHTVVLALVVLWLAAFTATHLHPEELPEIYVPDVVMHAAGFFILGGTFFLALLSHGVRRRRRDAIVLGVLAAYAAFDEITQPLIGRLAAWEDFLSDLAGTAAAVIVAEAICSLATRRRRMNGTS